MITNLSKAIGHVLQQAQGLSKQPGPGGPPEGLFASQLADSTLPEGLAEKLQQTLEHAQASGLGSFPETARSVLENLSLPQEADASEALAVLLANSASDAGPTLQAEAGEDGLALVASEDALLEGIESVPNGDESLSEGEPPADSAPEEGGPEPGLVPAPADPQIRGSTSGPPAHRAHPEVELPEVAIANALHSNGAPFERFRTDGDRAPVNGAVPPAVELETDADATADESVVSDDPVETAATGTSGLAESVVVAETQAAPGDLRPPGPTVSAPVNTSGGAVPSSEGEPRPNPDVAAGARSEAPIGLLNRALAGERSSRSDPASIAPGQPVAQAGGSAEASTGATRPAIEGSTVAALLKPAEQALNAPGSDFRSARANAVLASLRNGESAEPAAPQTAPTAVDDGPETVPALTGGRSDGAVTPANGSTVSPDSQAAIVAGAKSEVEAVAPARVESSAAQPVTRLHGENPPQAPPAVQPAHHVTADSAANAARTAYEPPVVTIRNVGDVAIQSVRHLVGSGEQTITIKLVPESLGTLQVTLTRVDDGVEIALASANQGVRHVLEHQLYALRDALSREGVDVTRAVVTVPNGTEADAGLGRQQAGQTGQFDRSAPFRQRDFAYPQAPEGHTHHETVYSAGQYEGQLNVLV